jgi:hypothetical protein
VNGEKEVSSQRTAQHSLRGCQSVMMYAERQKEGKNPNGNRAAKLE